MIDLYMPLGYTPLIFIDKEEGSTNPSNNAIHQYNSSKSWEEQLTNE